LGLSYVQLDEYRDKALDAPLLDALDQGFAQVRAAGVKVIPRFVYNFGLNEPDAPKHRILEHIGQLAPVLQSNVDVIASMYAGFIGAWGEWHHSTNGLLYNYQDKYDILESILQALPGSRMVQLRYPVHKQARYGDPLSAADAYDGSFAARVGHHNDCFLASDDDWGTYPIGQIEMWKDYLQQDTSFVVMSGETCNPNPPRSDCPTALAEMERFHYSHVHQDYHPNVVASWESQGCRDDMERKLGYRLAVESVTYPPAVRPGGVVPLSVRLRNHGWAAPFNPRSPWLVLDGVPADPDSLTFDHSARYQVVVPDVDARRWSPGASVELDLRLQLPADIEEGTYDLALWLPDEAPSLRYDARYSVQLANEGVWDAHTGLNRLISIVVDCSAPGGSNPDATELTILP
jgi:hypothetical protein